MKVKHKYSKDETYDIYGTRYDSEDDRTYFFIRWYGDWRWIDSNDFEPI